MINNTTLTGRTTKEVELKYTAGGTPVANITVAVERNFTNAQGEREVDFINCVAWQGIAETMAQHVTKGELIGITGSLQSGQYQDNDGKTIYTTNVRVDNFTFLESKGVKQQRAEQAQSVQA